VTIVDSEGRLWGRWNLFDVVLAIVVIALVPLGYGAYALFRTPAPRLLAVSPDTLTAGPNLRVTIKGENLRPYLRVSFGTVQGATFQFMDSQTAVVELNEMPPGIYDVVLYDYGQERSRMPGAFTMTASSMSQPQTQVLVAGRFINLTESDVKQVLAGIAMPTGAIVETAPPVVSVPRVYSGGVPIDLPTRELKHVPALVRANCTIRTTDGLPECMGASHALRINYIVAIPREGGTPLSFQIDDVRGDLPIVTLQAQVRFTGAAAALAAMRPGDLDTTAAYNPLALGMRLVSVGPEAGGRRDATVAIRAQQVTSGWQHFGGFAREGAVITFRTPDWEANATIVSVQVPPSR
jgi:hypothetical protein